jgi:predicted amidohydrolase YtcJ
LDRDIFEAQTKDISKTQVLSTVVDGKQVYGEFDF